MLNFGEVMKEKVLIFVPYQDADNFLFDGILTREFAMLYMLHNIGYRTVINVKKPRTVLDRKKYVVNEKFYPEGTIESMVKKILDNSKTLQYLPIINLAQLVKKRSWWIKGYTNCVYHFEIESNKDYLAYSDNPFAVRMLSTLSKDGCKIYFDIMDNFAIHPSLSDNERRAALESYKEIFQFADVISANSLQTCSFMSNYTDKEIRLVKNGVFLNNEANVAEDIEAVREIQRVKINYKKCVGYIGKLGLRLDADLIDVVTSRCEDTLFVFVGGYLKGQINEKLLDIFNSRDNVLHIDAVPSAYVYPILNEFDVLTIPHSVGKAENGGDPLKLYQYLTRHKPIITTSILGVDEFKEYIKIENDVNGWVAFINDNISVKKADTDKFTWCNRMKRVLEEFQ